MLELQERTHQDMINERQVERTKRLEAEKRREVCEIKRLKEFMEFAMNAIVNAVKKATKKTNRNQQPEKIFSGAPFLDPRLGDPWTAWMKTEPPGLHYRLRKGMYCSKVSGLCLKNVLILFGLTKFLKLVRIVDA